MVLLPLVQLLSYQGADLRAMQSQRAVLDPMADAVALQRSLVAHGDVANAVLQGRPKLEPLRLQRQAEVDRRVEDLGRTLSVGVWERALDEAHALEADWVLLARQVATRSISAEHSNLAHRLRVEQALQVMDLLSLALAPGGQDMSGVARVAALAREHILARPRTTWSPNAGSRAETSSDWQALQDADLNARFEPLLQAGGQAARWLDERTRGVQQARLATLLGLAAGAVMSLLLLRSLVTGPLRAGNPTPPSTPRQSRPESGETGRLLHRLRQQPPGKGRGEAAQLQDTQPTLPPRL